MIGFSEAKVEKIREAAKKLDTRGGAFKVSSKSFTLSSPDLYRDWTRNERKKKNYLENYNWFFCT
jgi:hypothetical protein